MTISAVIFDCDGTLVDTEELCAQADISMLAEHGIVYKSVAQYQAEFFGLSKPAILAGINKKHGTSFAVDRWGSEFASRVRALIPAHMRVFPESLDYVRMLAARGYALAVVSNGIRELILSELKAAGYLDIIVPEHVLSFDSAPRPKPAPDLYLKAAQGLGVEPVSCLVVEDSAIGAAAGVAAGMKVIGYTGLAHDPKSAAESLEKAGCVRVINYLPDLESELS